MKTRGKLFTTVIFVAVVLAHVALAQTAPTRVLPARYSYAAKFVCGWAPLGLIRWTPVPPLRHTEPGHYSTIVNIHNPWEVDVTILKKVVVSAHELEVPTSPQQKESAIQFQNFKNETSPIYPTIRFQETLKSDQSMSVDCPEIQNLLSLSFPTVPATGLFREGYVVIEAFLPSPLPAQPRQLDVTVVSTTAALHASVANPAGAGEFIPAVPIVLFDQQSLDHEVTIVPGRLLAAGKWPEGGPPVPPPPTSGPGGSSSPLTLYVCNNLSIDAAHYGIGYLTTHPQFCSPNTGSPAPTPQPVPSNIATPIGKTAHSPWGDVQIFRCNLFNVGSALYGIGVLTTHPQFCSQTGPPEVPKSSPFANAVTGWTVGGDQIWRCDMFTLDLLNLYGIGILTTHPQHCDHLGTVPPGSPANATDTGLKVP